jgi:hypothetical protein
VALKNSRVVMLLLLITAQRTLFVTMEVAGQVYVNRVGKYHRCVVLHQIFVVTVWFALTTNVLHLVGILDKCVVRPETSANQAFYVTVPTSASLFPVEV